MRRPSGAHPGNGDTLEESSTQKQWDAGQTVALEDVPVDWLLASQGLIIEEAYYYHKLCRIAGQVLAVQKKGDHVYFTMDVSGTSDENMLRYLTGRRGTSMRVHKCKAICSGEEAADDLVHGVRGRAMTADGVEEGWVRNVSKAVPAAEDDELMQLRARVPGGGPVGPGNGEKGPEKAEEEKDGKKAKKKKKDKDKKGKKEGKRSSSSDVELDGSKPRQASQKKPKRLFSGTGLDPVEKVRAKVARSARKHLAKKGQKSSSSSSESDTEEEIEKGQLGEESIFQQANRVRSIAENYPGALAAAAISQMRSCLLQELGTEEKRGAVTPVALQYMRQAIQKKASGGVLREVLTLSSSIDQLLRGRAAQSLDLMVQRLKSIEATLNGSHWSVAQKLEIPPPEQASLTGLSELKDARKETAQEASTRRLASYPDGSSGGQQKGGRNGAKSLSEAAQEDAGGAGTEIPGGSSEEARPGSDIPGGQCERLPSPEAANQKVSSDRTEDNPYEGGSAQAPWDVNDKKELGRGQSARGGFKEATSASVFALELQPVEPAGSFDSCSAPGRADRANGAHHSAENNVLEPLGVEGFPLGSCGPFVFQKILEVVTLRSKPMGKRDKSAIYPLPTSRTFFEECGFDLDPNGLSWLQCIVVSLNSVWGSELFYDGPVNAGQRKCLEGLVKDVQRFCKIEAIVPNVDWNEMFQVRAIDYRGEEVKVAKRFAWGNIAPALPDEVGRVPLVDVCTKGCRHYVEEFSSFLKPQDEWGRLPRPRVMVDDADWAEVCQGLVQSGVCTFIEESDVFSTPQGPLLNGLFGVTKEEWTASNVEIYRLIMNLIPLNKLCQPISGDVDTLPSWGSMSPFFVQPTETLRVSSEDVRCFFYTMAVPTSWIPFLAFNKLVPDLVLPEHLRGGRVYLASRVLPMGFLNSVSLAQHVHRNLVQWSQQHHPGVNPPEGELRKDRPMSVRQDTWRVYLDNFDLLEKVQATQVVDYEGTCPPGVLALKQEYETWGVPRNVKKSVSRSSLCELQGATVDGQLGVAFPRESKLVKYFSLALALVSRPQAQLKQWQIVCGGLVYFTMFRRPLLGCLNAVWLHMETYNGNTWVSKVSPQDCKLEVLRLLGLLALARLDFRLGMVPIVTCSDASTTGGGICASRGLTQTGAMVAEGDVRGSIPECPRGLCVFVVSLFDGIGSLRVALDCLGVTVAGFVSVEVHPPARRVVESHYPGVVHVDGVELVDFEMVQSWGRRFGQCDLVLLGAGPPCQGVSGLNADRKGALKDHRSNLFLHVPRVEGYLRKVFKWCPVHQLVESVASMDNEDKDTMSQAFGTHPIRCDAGDLTWAHRPRLYWLTWDIYELDGYSLDGDQLILSGEQPLSEVLSVGWRKVDETNAFPTFTTSRPRQHPGRRPAGVHHCDVDELQRWHEDSFRFPPYQYRQCHGVVNRTNQVRVPSVEEREVILGLPLHYTQNCVPKNERKLASFRDVRLTLLGNAWSIPVVACLLNCLFATLGWTFPKSAQQVLDTCRLEKVLLHILELMQSKAHCVVVVAEGCGDTLLQSSGEVDGAVCLAASRDRLRKAPSKPEIREQWATEQHTATGAALAHFAWCFAKVKAGVAVERDPKIVDAVVLAALQKKLSYMAWWLATLRVSRPSVWQSMAAAVQRKLDAAVSFGPQDEQLLEALTARVRWAEPRSLSNIAWACAALSHRQQPFPELLISEVMSQGEDLAPQGVANVAWKTPLLDMLSSLIEQRCCEFGAQELANAAWAAAVLEIHEMQMGKIAREAAAYASSRRGTSLGISMWQMDSQCMANTLWGLARLACRDEPLLLAFGGARSVVLQGGTQEMGSFVWAMCKLVYKDQLVCWGHVEAR
eukprot:Skav229726  [mRNA]  locus=scaffold49:399186:411683:- [translate_table: standard]